MATCGWSFAPNWCMALWALCGALLHMVGALLLKVEALLLALWGKKRDPLGLVLIWLCFVSPLSSSHILCSSLRSRITIATHKCFAHICYCYLRSFVAAHYNDCIAALTSLMIAHSRCSLLLRSFALLISLRILYSLRSYSTCSSHLRAPIEVSLYCTCCALSTKCSCYLAALVTVLLVRYAHTIVPVYSLRSYPCHSSVRYLSSLHSCELRCASLMSCYVAALMQD
jgi:hypothetical protein